jgi:asparagine synthase (glutamine-hydrolysing)
MCGITGFISATKNIPNPTGVIKAMIRSLAHRGPDEGDYAEFALENTKQVFLGHRRLKIIDLSSTGHQPMFNFGKNTCIVYNGEIYNYIELKNELAAKGYKFISTSDTEVVLYAYEEWGTECFKRFNGMWAIAIFDKTKQKIILSRDRFGKKPLYYFKSRGNFVFGSEPKALFLHPCVTKEPNYEKVFRYISTNYRYVDIDDKTFFKDIFQVPKSSFMEIDNDLNLKTTAYWALGNNMVNPEMSDSQAVNEYRDLLVDSVKLRLRSDVPVGCMLSGGLDSTSITCIAYKILNKPIVTFSGVTGDLKGIYDESEYINAVIDETKSDSHYIRPDPVDLFKTIDEILSFHDEPVCTVTWYSLYLIAKKVRLEYVPVVLNGHGGDELLGGYWDHYHYNFYDLRQQGDLQALEYEIKAWKDNHHRDTAEIPRYQKYINDLVEKKVSEMSRFPDYSDCFMPDLVQKYRRPVNCPNPFMGFLSRRLYSETMFETIPASLRPEDRNTMSKSIESRSPFLDYRLVEFCFSLANKFKIRDGVGKWLTREAMRGILPEVVRMRKDKSGFIAPADDWFRTTNRSELIDLTCSDSLARRKLFNVAQVKKTLSEHLEKKANHQMFIWQLINLELWFRRFFDV